jgi:hypothetical protein
MTGGIATGHDHKEARMPTVMNMKWRGVTPEQYEAARAKIDWEGQPADGGLFHVAWFDDDGLRVVDLWESAEQFQRFTEERLMPGVQEIGIEGEPEVEMTEAHAVFTPAYEPAGA